MFTNIINNNSLQSDFKNSLIKNSRIRGLNRNILEHLFGFIPRFHRGVDRIPIASSFYRRYDYSRFRSGNGPQGKSKQLGLVGKPRDPSGYEGILIGNGFVGQPMEPFLIWPCLVEVPIAGSTLYVVVFAKTRG